MSPTTDRPRILLVNPFYATRNLFPVHAQSIVGKYPLASVTLPTIAALTPRGFDVKIVDTAVEKLDYDTPCDLVGVTGLHSHVETARRIMGEFRRRGKKVVVGGPSVTVSPEKWRPYADYLVLGEAERVWPEFVRDFEAGKPQAEYRQEGPVDLADAPLPRYDLLEPRRYITGVVQASRSCPFQCDFCDVITFLGRGIRYKPVDQVIAEIEQVRALGWRTCFLADDNITAKREKAYELFEAMRRWNARQKQPLLFITSFSVDTARDPDLLKLAASAGVTRAFVGVETPNEESLKESKKRQNLKRDLVADVRTITSHGIGVIGGSVVGFDNDELDIFKRSYEFYQSCGTPIVNCYILQALDGTPLKERMQREGRYISEDDYEQIRAAEGLMLPQGYGVAPSIRPKKMTLKQLEDGFRWMTARVYSREGFVERVRRMFELLERAEPGSLLRHRAHRLSFEELKIVYRLLAYYRKTRGNERRLWNEVLLIGMRSKFPQKTAMLAWLLLSYTSNRINLIQYNGIDPLDEEALARLPYPVRSDGGAAARGGAS